MSTTIPEQDMLNKQEREFLDHVEERINELKKQKDDLRRLESIRAALIGKTAPARPVSRAGRKSGRMEEFLAVVRANPGITVSEATEKMTDIAPNYLYRVKSNAEAKNLVRVEGSKIFAVEEAPEPVSEPVVA